MGKKNRRKQAAYSPDSPRVAVFLGAQFRLADKVGVLPLMRFAKAASSGLDSADMEGLAAMYDFLRQVVHPHDWARFEEHAIVQRADDEDVQKFVQDAVAIVSGRPTSRPSVSSDGSPTTSPSSADDSSSLAVQRDLEAQGRPDLALMVLEAREARGSRASA